MLKILFLIAILVLYLILFSFSVLLQYLVDKEEKENGKSKLYYILFLYDSIPNFIIGFMVLDVLERHGYNRYGSAELIISVFFAWLPFEVYKYYFRKKFFGNDGPDSLYKLGL